MLRSDFVQQHAVDCNFTSPESWIILSPLEQSIKQKIEAVGTPLKDWGVDIYRGVLTGCNEAFVITTAKRNEILSTCKTEDERNRTAELIRPILRGRDIKRYGYNWAGLWLINTHNGIKGKIPRISIENYPAIQEHLDHYWEAISKRADKGDTPYNLRNCAYTEDFSKPKIVWAETMRRHRSKSCRFPRFSYDNSGSYLDKTCFMGIGDDAEYIMIFLNSYIGEYLCGKYVSILDNGGYLMQKIYLNEIPIPNIDNSDKSKVVALWKERADENIIDEYFFKILNFTIEEINYIKSPLCNKEKEAID